MNLWQEGLNFRRNRVLPSQKNWELDYALRMYTKNVEFVCRYRSCKLHQECHHPWLFEQANKSDLANELTKNSTKLIKSLTKTINVVHGGALLHQVYWNVPATYAEILMQYTFYVDKKYGKRCLIVLDGCKSGTKYEECQRRSTQGSAEVAFQLHNELQFKHQFLANSSNKEQLS